MEFIAHSAHAATSNMILIAIATANVELQVALTYNLSVQF